MSTNNRIRDLRSKLGISQEELAERTGISQRQISRYETDTNDPPGEALLSLAQVLNTSTDYLLGKTDDATPHFRSDDLDPSEQQIIAALRRGDDLEAIKLIVNG